MVIVDLHSHDRHRAYFTPPGGFGLLICPVVIQSIKDRWRSREVLVVVRSDARSINLVPFYICFLADGADVDGFWIGR